MKILILGGSLFLGKAITEIALKNNFDITHFNRGKSNPAESVNINFIHGDRRKDLYKVEDNDWDAVIDTCGYFPEDVAESAAHFFTKTQRYIYISSVSAYSDFSKENITEEQPISSLLFDHNRKITNDNYGSLKAACEQEVYTRYRDRAIIIRPGFITGQDDYSDRFTFWLYQCAKYDPIYSPPLKDAKIQFIDVLDLAAWILKLIADQENGIFNATNTSIMFSKMLEIMQEVVGEKSKRIELNRTDLQRLKINTAIFFPLWMDPNRKDFKGINSINSEKAIRTGLTFRSPIETFEHLWNYYLSQTREKLRAGFSEEEYLQLFNSKLG